MSLTIICYPYGPLGENTYLVTDDDTGLKAVIDPGYIGKDVMDAIGDKSSLKYVLLTHGHHDHFAAAQSYINEYPDSVFVVPAGEEYLLRRSRDNIMMARGNGSGTCPEAGLKVAEGDIIDLGKTQFRVIETPGHTEGGICFATDEVIFTGDTLFRLSVGNTGFETGNWETLVRSIETKLYVLDGALKVLPGHGPASTIEFEKRANPFV